MGALFAQVQAGPEGAEQMVMLIRYPLMVGEKGTREAAGFASRATSHPARLLKS